MRSALELTTKQFLVLFVKEFEEELGFRLRQAEMKNQKLDEFF
jgi:hypothetical protein